MAWLLDHKQTNVCFKYFYSMSISLKSSLVDLTTNVLQSRTKHLGTPQTSYTDHVILLLDCNWHTLHTIRYNPHTLNAAEYIKSVDMVDIGYDAPTEESDATDRSTNQL